MSFSIGDKVICIDSSIQGHTLLELSKDMPNWIEKGKEYTVREINTNKGIVLGVLVEEVSNPVKFFRLVNRFQEPAFADWRFRKKEEAYVDPLEVEETKVVDLQIQDYSYSDYKY